MTAVTALSRAQLDAQHGNVRNERTVPQLDRL